MSPRRRIDPETGRRTLAGWVTDPDGADRRTVALVVRWSLEELSTKAPGSSVEVRVPPFGVAQCVDGSRHTRGTPPNVVETDATTWLNLVTGRLSWDEALARGVVRASGTRADLSAWLPFAHFDPGTSPPCDR
jgi:hypothetical protein